jgi:hypothetical protein
MWKLRLSRFCVLNACMLCGNSFKAVDVFCGCWTVSTFRLVSEYRCVEIEGFDDVDVVQHIIQFFYLHAMLPREGVSLWYLPVAERLTLRPSSRGPRDAR